jgi:hypothetical protein
MFTYFETTSKLKKRKTKKTWKNQRHKLKYLGGHMVATTESKL